MPQAGGVTRRGGRTTPCTRRDARTRLDQANAYLEVAELTVGERGDEWSSVAAGVAVLAGIAAADAIGCVRAGERSRGRDHRQAAVVLESATPDGAALADSLIRLLDVKDQAHDGTRVVSAAQARGSIRRARTLVDRAVEELAR